MRLAPFAVALTASLLVLANVLLGGFPLACVRHYPPVFRYAIGFFATGQDPAPNLYEAWHLDTFGKLPTGGTELDWTAIGVNVLIGLTALLALSLVADAARPRSAPMPGPEPAGEADKS